MATIEDKLKIGEMPAPCYLTEKGNTDPSSDGSAIKWIGIRAYGLDKNIKDFLWWRNFKVGNLNSGVARQDTTAFITRLYLETGAEAAIGLPIDLLASSQASNYVDIINEKGAYGVYVDAKKRPMFNFFTMIEGVRSEKELRKEKPAEFARVFQWASEVLPYDRR